MRVYLLSAGLARLADEMVGLALVLFVLARTGDQALAGATVAAYTVPSIVSGPLLGAWLDRTRRPLIALAGNQFLLAATAAGLLVAVEHPPALLGLAFLAGTTLPMTSGGFTSLLPRLATDLPRATAADALLFNAAALGGPALTGVLAAVVGGNSAVVAIGVLALVAGLCTLGLRVPPHAATEHPPLWRAMRAGTRHLATTPPLRGATLATVLGHGAIGLLATALPVHVTTLGRPEGAAGFVWAAMEVGCVVSLLALRRHLPRWRPEHVVFATVAASGLALATWPLAPNFVVLPALGLLVGLAQGPTLTSIITTRQRYTPSTLLGQVSTTGASLRSARSRSARPSAAVCTTPRRCSSRRPRRSSSRPVSGSALVQRVPSPVRVGADDPEVAERRVAGHGDHRAAQCGRRARQRALAEAGRAAVEHDGRGGHQHRDLAAERGRLDLEPLPRGQAGQVEHQRAERRPRLDPVGDGRTVDLARDGVDPLRRNDHREAFEHRHEVGGDLRGVDGLDAVEVLLPRQPPVGDGLVEHHDGLFPLLVGHPEHRLGHHDHLLFANPLS